MTAMHKVGMASKKGEFNFLGGQLGGQRRMTLILGGSALWGMISAYLVTTAPKSIAFPPRGPDNFATCFGGGGIYRKQSTEETNKLANSSSTDAVKENRLLDTAEKPNGTRWVKKMILWIKLGYENLCLNGIKKRKSAKDKHKIRWEIKFKAYAACLNYVDNIEFLRQTITPRPFWPNPPPPRGGVASWTGRHPLTLPLPLHLLLLLRPFHP